MKHYLYPHKNKQGKLKCLQCGKYFAHLGSHVSHGHGATAREYKEEHGLPYSMPLISDTIINKKRDAWYKHEDKYLKNIKHKGTPFKKGQRVARRFSEHERNKIIETISRVNKRHNKLQNCIVCNMQFKHIESHLFNAHGLLIVGANRSSK